ncbi:MAG: protein translocase subunit SecF [bacterium]
MSLKNIKLPKIEFVGHRKVTYIISAVLILIGLLAMVARGGMRYGIDFTGGIVIQAHFDKQVPVSEIRDAVISQGYENSIIQRYGTANDYLITFQGDIEKQADTLGPEIVRYSTYPNPTAGEDQVAVRLTAYDKESSVKNIFVDADFYDEIQPVSADDKYDNNEESGRFTLSVDRFTEDTVITIRAFAVDYNDNRGPEREIRIQVSESDEPSEGIIPDFEKPDYKLKETAQSEFSPTTGLINALKNKFPDTNVRIDREEIVGPTFSKELQKKSLWVVLIGLAGILVYVWIRFTFRFGVAAIIALFHDVLITLGIFAVTNKEITIPIIAAILTLIGYSINDSIVISDRIRENKKLLRKKSFGDIINISLNQTMSRTIITSLTTLIVLIALYIFGGAVINDFAFALIIGVIIGTYSSIYIVAQIVFDWEDKYPTRKVR